MNFKKRVKDIKHRVKEVGTDRNAEFERGKGGVKRGEKMRETEAEETQRV